VNKKRRKEIAEASTMLLAVHQLLEFLQDEEQAYNKKWATGLARLR
jgi:hypothetical protein